MKELCSHIVDIVTNSIAAHSQSIEIKVTEDLAGDKLQIEIVDNGIGMAKEILKKVGDPFYTSRTTRKVGLGIPLLKEAAEATNGRFEIQSSLKQGTHVFAEFTRSHIDRMPLGDLAETFTSLLISYPQVHWTLAYTYNEKTFYFDDTKVKEEISGISISHYQVVEFLRDYIKTGIQNVQSIPQSAE